MRIGPNGTPWAPYVDATRDDAIGVVGRFWGGESLWSRSCKNQLDPSWAAMDGVGGRHRGSPALPGWSWGIPGGLAVGVVAGILLGLLFVPDRTDGALIVGVAFGLATASLVAPMLAVARGRFWSRLWGCNAAACFLSFPIYVAMVLVFVPRLLYYDPAVEARLTPIDMYLRFFVLGVVFLAASLIARRRAIISSFLPSSNDATKRSR